MGLCLSDFIIVSDIDGTLLGSDHTIPKRNFEAVERFRQAGGRFTIATGRAIETARLYAKTMEIDLPAVICNGALVYDYDNEKPLHIEYMDVKARDYPFEMQKLFPSIAIELFSDDKIYAYNRNEFINDFLEREKLNDKVIIDGALPDKLNKMLIADDPKIVDMLEDHLARNVVMENVYCVRTSKFFLEIMPSNISKGSGIKKLAEILGSDVENMVAVGDFFNDLEMIKMAGIGIVTANSPEKMWKAADLKVCSCDEGAIGDVVEYLEKLCGKI